MAIEDEFVRDFAQALADQNAAVFAGAGLSIPAGMVDWKGLMREIASDVGLDVEKEDDLIAVAQYHYNEKQTRYHIHQALVHELSDRSCISENHKILARLPIKEYWTTNY